MKLSSLLETEPLHRFLFFAGEMMDRSLDGALPHTSFEAPLFEGALLPKIWYRLPLEDGLAGDGSPYHVYIKAGRTADLCIFFSGGGMAWNPYTAARPYTGGRMLSGEPAFYTHNLRPVTEFSNINRGITETENPENPFDDWSFLVITYATGDLHLGDATLTYTDRSGKQRTHHFHGYRNYRAAMEKACAFFPAPGRLLIAGDSAGAFAVPALAGEIAEEFYPSCEEITLLSDSGQLETPQFAHILEEVWHAPAHLAKALDSPNPTICWYRRLHERYGSRFRYLYASSTRDHVLSAYYSELHGGGFRTDRELQTLFYDGLGTMVRSLKQMEPETGLFIHGIMNPLPLRGGTVHTILREPFFYTRLKRGISMAQWLKDAVEGNIYDTGVKK